MRNFTLGFMTMGLIAMFIIRYYPTPETEEACAKCGSKYCYPLKSGIVVCDDCGYRQKPEKEGESCRNDTSGSASTGS